MTEIFQILSSQTISSHPPFNDYKLYKCILTIFHDITSIEFFTDKLPVSIS